MKIYMLISSLDLKVHSYISDSTKITLKGYLIFYNPYTIKVAK